MLRRTFLTTPLLAHAAEVHYRDYSRILPDYVSRLAAEAHQRRLTALAKLTSADAIAARQSYIRQTLWKIIGGPLERTPLRTRTTGTFQREGYRVENLIYESRPGFHIAANLYIPAGTGPFPGVLFQMGHSRNGKAYTSYQKCCQGLARLGYLVLAFDPMGQGERVYYPQANGNMTRLASSDDEHTLPGRQLLLVGSTSTQIQLWDAVRSLDLLVAHPLCDPKRIASTGQSGGATLTMLLAAVDDRLTTAVICSANTENIACPGFNPPGSTDDAEQNLIDGGTLGIDRWDLLYPFAPKPMLSLVSARDFFGTYSPNYLVNGREEFAHLARVYGLLNASEKVAWEELPLPHALSYASRMRVYNWFEKWLKGSDRNIAAEPATAPEADEKLYASKTGNVVRDLGGKTPLALARDRLQTATTRATAIEIEQMLRVDRVPVSAFTIVSKVPAPAGIRIEAAETASVPGVHLPAWLFHPATEDASKAALLFADAGGRAARWDEGSLYQNLAARGHFVCAADVRGIGDLRPEYPRGAQGHASSHVSEENYAWAGLALGKPLVGQRVSDLLALIGSMRKAAPKRRLILAATGRMCIPALFAAALEPAVDAAWLHQDALSYRKLLESEEYSEPLANFLPGVLLRFDLPEVAALISAPRRLRLSAREPWEAESFVSL